ncbi:hypothetical protein MA16_Dca017018 [Dendrobium catenatum]|uniref:Uncharacterized protein n=1 Tax=Dendrobium catenatum TaxID=906689 RepID=A0A2I0XEW1_9ASPA|nr:hypothetical protein MA16_Dca017018 [Dendrobium catenatum]
MKSQKTPNERPKDNKTANIISTQKTGKQATENPTNSHGKPSQQGTRRANTGNRTTLHGKTVRRRKPRGNDHGNNNSQQKPKTTSSPWDKTE